MKTLAFVLTTIFTYTASMAQGTGYDRLTIDHHPLEQAKAKKEQRFSKGELQGPRAKNYPTHRLSASPVVTVTPNKLSNRRMGPAAKNYRPGQNDQPASRKLVTKKERKNLKGPRAKNRKPGDR